MRFQPAEHPPLFKTMVKVTNLANGKSVVVRINDRGPFSKSRIIDLSRAAAQKLDMIASGTAKVRIETIAKQVQDTINQDTLSSDVKKEFFEIDVKTANHGFSKLGLTRMGTLVKNYPKLRIFLSNRMGYLQIK